MRSLETPRAGRRAWLGLAVLALPCLVVTMDLTVLYLAVPRLSAELKPSSSQLLWIVDIYGFMIAGSLLTMGALGDRIGRRRLLLIGAAAFALISVVASLSTSPEMLIAARALLGVAGATLMPSTLALIRAMFADPRQRSVAIGAWATSLSCGAAIGPLLGGALLHMFWWGAAFLVSVPVVALLLAVGPRLLPEYRDAEARPLDVPSATLAVVAMLATIYGIKQIAEHSLSAASLTFILGGAAVGGMFGRRQLRLADPLIDVRLLRVPAFSASLAANTTALFALVGTDFFIAQYLQLVLGMDPFEAGLWSLPGAAGFIAGSMLVPLALRWVQATHAVAGGLSFAAMGAAILTRVEGGSGLGLVVLGSVCMALGLALVGTLGTDLILSAAPPERAGAASAISETGTELGAALGVAILGSIGTAIYRDEVARALPSGISPSAAEAVRDTLGGAFAVADQVPASLVAAANTAFADGLHASALITAAALLAMAVVMLALRRGPTQPSASASN